MNFDPASDSELFKKPPPLHTKIAIKKHPANWNKKHMRAAFSDWCKRYEAQLGDANWEVRLHKAKVGAA